jgi:hypothetical protein
VPGAFDAGDASFGPAVPWWSRATARRKDIMLARRVLPVLAAAVLLGSAMAQQALRPPNYYLFQLPRLTSGEGVTGTLSMDDGQNFKDGSYVDLYVIQGLEGDRVSISVSSVAFDAFVTLFDPDGYLVSSNDDYMEMGGDAGIDVTLYVDGAYLLVVSGYSQWDLGEYTVELRTGDSGSPTAAGTIDVPGTIESEITGDMPLHPNGYVGPTEYFGFEVTEDSLVLLTLTSFDFDTVLTVFDELGNEIGQNDDYDATSDSQVALQLSPGTYVVAASSYYTGEGGSYSLTIDRFVRAP